MSLNSVENRWSKADFRVAYAFGAASALPIAHTLAQPVTWATMKILEATGIDPMMQLLVGFPAAAIGVMGAATGLSVSAGAGVGEIFHQLRRPSETNQESTPNEPL